MTEFKCYEGPIVYKVYLGAILDLYDRSIVSWAISKRNDNKLLFDILEQAVADNPEAKPIFHSDRGFQYTSRSFQTRPRTQKMTQSMSRVGDCIDNGPMEVRINALRTDEPTQYPIPVNKRIEKYKVRYAA